MALGLDGVSAKGRYQNPAQRIISSLTNLYGRGLVSHQRRRDGWSGAAYEITPEGRAALLAYEAATATAVVPVEVGQIRLSILTAYKVLEPHPTRRGFWVVSPYSRDFEMIHWLKALGRRQLEEMGLITLRYFGGRDPWAGLEKTLEAFAKIGSPR